MYLTSIEAGLHKHSDGSDTQLKVVWGDVGGVTDDERECFHTLDKRLGVVLTQVLTQRQTVLVDQWVIQLSFRA